jgi:hypothetical protein
MRRKKKSTSKAVESLPSPSQKKNALRKHAINQRECISPHSLPCCHGLNPHLSLLGLPANHEVHGCEELLAATSDQSIGGHGQRVGGLLGALGRKANGLERADEPVRGTAADVGHTDERGEVPDALHVLELAADGPVPGQLVGAVGQVLVDLELEAGGLHGGDGNLDLLHVADTITELNAQADLAVVRIVVVVFVGHQPLVDAEDAAGLENAEDLAVDALETGSVDGGLDGVDGVEGVVREVHLHEVALGEGDLLVKTLLLGVHGSALNLVVVVVEAHDVAAGELCDLSCGSADTAADVQHSRALLDAHLQGQVVLVSCGGLLEGLALAVAAEVEALSPTILVQVCGKVVVVAGEGCVLVAAGLAVGIGLVASGLVVPMLEVLVDGLLLSLLVLAQNVSVVVGVLAGLAVEGVLELGVTLEILRFEGGGRSHCCWLLCVCC